MLRITFTGNAGSDPEVRFTAGGDEMVNLSVGVTTRRRAENGEWGDHTDWFRVRCMGRILEVAKRAQKGWRITCDGRPELRAYQNRNNELVATADVWADELECAPPAPRAPQSGAIVEPALVRANNSPDAKETEDIPF